MATFPASYHTALTNSNMSMIDIAKKLNIQPRRFYGILSGRNKMDRKEFVDIKSLVEHIQKDIHEYKT